MKKLGDLYLITFISINMLFALTIVCAPHSATLIIESFFKNPGQVNQENTPLTAQNIQQIQILGKTTGAIEVHQ